MHTINTKVIHCYAPKQVRALFKDNFDALRWQLWVKIKALFTVDIVREYSCQYSPARRLQILSVYTASCTSETALKGQRYTLWNNWQGKDELNVLWEALHECPWVSIRRCTHVGISRRCRYLLGCPASLWIAVYQKLFAHRLIQCRTDSTRQEINHMTLTESMKNYVLDTGF